MRKSTALLFSLLLAAAIAATPASARPATTPPPPKAKPFVRPGDEKTKKKGFLGLFGKKATPTPAATPTPTATAPTKKPTKPTKRRPVPERDNDRPVTNPPEGEKPTATHSDSNPPSANPPAGDNAATNNGGPAETQPPNAKGNDKPKPKKPETPPLDDGEKFKRAKESALDDDKIKDLKTKADSALTDSEAHAASIAYNRALFRKIRQIDPSLDKYVDRIEDAMMKRLNEEKRSD